MTVVGKYFAYGSNMNGQRVTDRKLRVTHACGAILLNYRMVFDKVSKQHPGISHANIIFDPGARVEGVLYWLETDAEILKMDVFEAAPINYGRDVIKVEVPHAKEGAAWAWTYFANTAVRAQGHAPTQDYLDHLLAGQPFLSAEYYEALRAQPVASV